MLLKSSNVSNWSLKTREEREKKAEAIFEEIIAENIPRTSRSPMNLKQDKYKLNHTGSHLSQMLKIKEKNLKSSQRKFSK